MPILEVLSAEAYMPNENGVTNSRNPALSTFLLSTELGLTQRAIFLEGEAGLLHCSLSAHFIGIIEPAALPKILEHVLGRDLRTALSV